MNVGQLKKILEGLPDSTLVVTSGGDHNYRNADVVATQAEYDKRYFTLYEYADEENRSAEDPDSVVIDVLWVG